MVLVRTWCSESVIKRRTESWGKVKGDYRYCGYRGIVITVDLRCVGLEEFGQIACDIVVTFFEDTKLISGCCFRSLRNVVQGFEYSQY